MSNQKPRHVAIIMDGNGRWAQKQNKMRIFGHQKGAAVINEIVKASLKENIKILSLFAFSCENWNRSKAEVNFLLKLLNKKLSRETIKFLMENNVRFKWIGFTKKIPKRIITKLLLIESSTKNNSKLTLNLCFNYGGQQDILNAAIKFKKVKHGNFEKFLLTENLPPVDLLIRTSGEQRISNFFLWQLAYAEILFEHTLWPDYNSKIFRKNILEFTGRQRRFGNI